MITMRWGVDSFAYVGPVLGYQLLNPMQLCLLTKREGDHRLSTPVQAGDARVASNIKHTPLSAHSNAVLGEDIEDRKGSKLLGVINVLSDAWLDVV